MVSRVFISYSKLNPTPTIQVANFLKLNGLSVWWDTNLTAGEDFTEVIESELNSADAIIVIWTPESIKSSWVRSEAAHAHRQNKLIPVRTRDVLDGQIPKPFDTLHTILVSDHEPLLAALQNVKPFATVDKAAHPPATDAGKRWQHIEASLDTRDYSDFLDIFEGAPETFEARRHKRQLEDWENVDRENVESLLKFEIGGQFPALAGHVARIRQALQVKINTEMEADRRRAEAERKEALLNPTVAVRVPRLGEDVVEATVGQWYKKDGRPVSFGSTPLNPRAPRSRLSTYASTTRTGLSSSIQSSRHSGNSVA